MKQSCPDCDKSKFLSLVAYQPARCVGNLTIEYIINAMDKGGTDKIPVADSKELKKLAECLETFGDTLKKSPANIALNKI